MNYKKILSIVLIISFFTFFFFYTKNMEKKAKVIEQKQPQVEEIADNNFIDRVEKSDLTYENLKSIYFSTKETYEPYPFRNGQTYQLVVFKSSSDTFKFFKSKTNMFLLKGDFLSDKITLDKDIKIGVDKAVFEKKFSKKITANNVAIVSEPEGFEYFTFIFNENKLIEIIYDTEDTFWSTD